MKQQTILKKSGIAERFAYSVTQVAGSTMALIIAFLIIVIWILAGPIFHFSESWLLIINTVTSIVTFLMVFLIQKAHNKDSLAIQLKLNELLAVHESANNKLVNAEHRPEEELKDMQKDYFRLTEADTEEIKTNPRAPQRSKTLKRSKKRVSRANN
jgi:low affinity Fe/Cu permease